MEQPTITFIGAGNMATSLIGGLIADGYAPDKLWVTDIYHEKLNLLHERYGIHQTDDNLVATEHAQVLILCVKPQVIRLIAHELSPIIRHQRQLVISIAAGITTTRLAEWLGAATPIVRCMPNTPALVGSAASGMFATASVTKNQKAIAESIMRAVGIVEWVEYENLLDVVTALSGSGPAYFFYLMEIAERTAIELGLSPKVAHLLTVETALGAAKMALQSNHSFAELRQHVTSPGGTTEAALTVMEQNKVHAIIADAIKAAAQRAKELQ